MQNYTQNTAVHAAFWAGLLCVLRYFLAFCSFQTYPV